MVFLGGLALNCRDPIGIDPGHFRMSVQSRRCIDPWNLSVSPWLQCLGANYMESTDAREFMLQGIYAGI